MYANIKHNFAFQLVRVGNTDSQNSILENPSSVGTISTGCQLSTNCQSSPCPATSHCVDEWDDYTCRCREGKYNHYN